MKKEGKPQCAVCLKVFSRADSVAKHIRKGSCPGEPDLGRPSKYCTIFEKEYQSAWHLGRHQSRMHQPLSPCFEYNRRFLKSKISTDLIKCPSTQEENPVPGTPEMERRQSPILLGVDEYHPSKCQQAEHGR